MSLFFLMMSLSTTLAASTVDPNVPASASQLTSAPIRSNFAATYRDINNILGCYGAAAAPSAPINLQTWCDATTLPIYVFKYWNAHNGVWVPYANLNINTNVYTPVVSSISILPVSATVPRNVALWMADDLYLEDFGGNGDAGPTFDNTPAFNLALATGNGFRVRAGGNYYFNTEPNQINKDFRISGPPNSTHQGIGNNSSNLNGQGTRIYRNYSTTSPNRGMFSWIGGYAYVGNLYLIASPGTSGGSMISMVPQLPTGVPPISIGDIKSVTVTSQSTNALNYSIYLDGSAEVSGLRTVFFQDVVAFGAAIRSVYLKSVIHFNWHGGAIAQAGGTDGQLEITGTSLTKSSENVISLDYISGNLILDYVIDSTFSVGEMNGSVVSTTNSSGITGKGILLGGSPSPGWLKSQWQSGDFFYQSPDAAISGGGALFSGLVKNTISQNTGTSFQVINSNAGVSAAAALVAANDVSSGAFGVAGSNYIDIAANANRAYVYSSPLLSGISLYADGNKTVDISTNGTQRASFNGLGRLTLALPDSVINSVSQNAPTVFSAININTGISAVAAFVVQNNVTSGAFGMASSNYVAIPANTNRVYAYSAPTSGGISFYADGVKPIVFSNNGVESGRFTGANTLTLGSAGVSSGALGFQNATSGTITIAPPAGALGANTLTLPIITDTLITRSSTDTLSNKSISGSANTMTNIPAASLTGTSLPASITTSSLTSFGSSPTLATPIINGLPTGTGVATANTASTLVSRDGSGNFAAGVISASLSGNATTATSSTTATTATNAATVATAANASFFPLFVASSTNSNQPHNLDTNFTYNPSTDTLSAVNFSGNASTASIASVATTTAVTDDVVTNAVMFPTWVTANTGNLPQKISSTLLTWNPSTSQFKVGSGADTPAVLGASIYITNNGQTSFVARDSTNDVETYILAGPASGIMGTFTNHAFNLRTFNTDRLSISGAGVFTFGTIPAADTATTDNTLCVSTTGVILKGSGASGVCLGTSSARYKRDIVAMGAGLSEIVRLNPRNFFYRKGFGDDGARLQYGFIAEDVVKVLPGVTALDKDGKPNSVDMVAMIPVLVNAIKQLESDNDNLRTDVSSLQAKSKIMATIISTVEQLKSDNDNMESMIISLKKRKGGS